MFKLGFTLALFLSVVVFCLIYTGGATEIYLLATIAIVMSKFAIVIFDWMK